METTESQFSHPFSPTLFLLCTLRYNKFSFFVCLRIKEGYIISCFSLIGDVHTPLNYLVKENKLTEKLCFGCIRTLLHIYSELKWTESSAVMDWTNTLQMAAFLIAIEWLSPVLVVVAFRSFGDIRQRFCVKRTSVNRWSIVWAACGIRFPYLITLI